MTIKELLVTCAAAVAASGTAFASHSEWSGQTGQITIGEGKTWTADDEDIAYIDANISRITVKGTLILDNITKWPKGTGATTACLFWQSTGAVIKHGESTLVFSDQRDNYRTSATLVVEEGELDQENRYIWGDNNNGTIWVKDRATFRQNYSCTHGSARFVIEGTGKNDQGAVIMDKASAGALAYVVLSNDATIVVNSTTANLFGSHASSGSYAARDPAILEMNGHTLTIGGTATSIGFKDEQVSGGGAIKFAAGTARTLKPTGTTDFGATKLIVEGDLTLETGAWNDIEVADGATLYLMPTDANTTIAINGNISGAGSVQIGADGTPAVGSVRLAGNNSYMGTTKLYGAEGFVLSLASGSGIPDYSKFTQVGGTIVPMVGYKDDGVTPRWTAAQVLSMAKEQDVSTMKLDVSDTTDFNSLTIDGMTYATYFPTTGPAWGALGAGLGGYSFEGPFPAENPLGIELDTGAIRLTGNKAINLGQTLVTGTAENRGGELVIDGAKDVKFGESLITLGSNTSSDPLSCGTLTISNATLSSDVMLTTADTDMTKGALWVGRYTQGILRIGEGAVVSNRVVVGGASSDTWDVNRKGTGAIYQNGGKLYPRGTSNKSLYFGSAIGAAGHGYYELKGDAYCEFARNFALGCFGTGIIMQYGGTIKATSGFYLGYNNYNGYHRAIYYLRKGTFVAKSTFYMSYASGVESELTVDGPEAKVEAYDTSIAAHNSKSANVAIVNLNNGGVIQLRNFSPTVEPSDSNPFPFIVNFNGGVVKHGYYYANPFVNGNTEIPVSRVAIYEKGLVLDSDSGTDDGGTTMNNNGVDLVGATEGNGVQAINLSEPLAGWIAAPRVDISGGGGYGASAVAEIDSDTATITNILITSHGWGYTSKPSVTLVTCRDGYGKKKTIASGNVEIGPNEVGGLTKIGEGTLSVYGSNSWAKWTRVDAGTLKVMSDTAIPPDTELVLNGNATLDCNGKVVPAFTGLSGTGGTVQNGTVKIVGEWKISAKKFLDRETTAITGTLDLTDCTGITLTDTEVLDEAAKQLKGLKLFTATTVVGLADVEVSGVPKGWKVSKVGNGIRLSSERGAALIVR